MKAENFYVRLWAIFAILAMTLVLVVPQLSLATTSQVWFQGFEVDTSDWDGDITRVASGDNGIASAGGSFHAIANDNVTTFSRFDGYRDTWTGEWHAEIDVYLDPNWATGEGFDYSVAANGSDGNHQRDYIFHVGVVEDTNGIVGKKLLVNGSNNADFTTNPFKLTNENGGVYHEVTSAGWYTLQHRFYDDGGALSVDLNLIDDQGTVLWTATRSNALDVIPDEIGGNRYAWFTHIDVAGGIAVDNHRLKVTVPFERTAEILSPTAGEEVNGVVDFAAVLNDVDGDDNVQWAVRSGTCAAGTGTIAGNVDGFTTDFDWDNANFSASVDMSALPTGSYCFVFNPTESAGDEPIRLTRNFTLVDPAPTDPEMKEQCMDGGWEDYGFKNQGQCVRFVETGKDSR